MNTQDPEWYKRRRYLHFDLPIGPKQAIANVTDPDRVAAHSFYPFVHTTIKSTKTSTDPQTKRRERKIKERDVAYAAHVDSHVYAYYAHLLTSLYETAIRANGVDSCSLAFRPLGKSNIEFAKEAFDQIVAHSPCCVLAIDVKGFFDNLDHDLLKSAWARILGLSRLPQDHFNVYKSVTQWCFVDKEPLYERLGISIHNPNKGNRTRLCTPEQFRKLVRGGGLLKPNAQRRGIPQGSPISAILSNVYMFSFDEKLLAYASAIGAAYYRYCDDIILILPAAVRDEVHATLLQLISEVQLEVQEEKTEERYFELVDGHLTAKQPIQYLGFTFDGEHMRIRETSLCRYFERMRRGVRIAQNTKRKCDSNRISDGRSAKPLYLKKLYRKYSYLGRRNFVSYGSRAVKLMHSNSIRRQLKPLWEKLIREIPSSD